MVNNYELLATDNWQLTTGNCLVSSTTVEKPLQISSFLTNKANFPDAQMNVTTFLTKEYENKSNCKLGENKANTKPNKANLLNTQMNVSSFLTKEYENISNWTLRQNKANTNPIQTQSNPIAKAKLKPCKLELIKHIWGYKSTMALTFARNSLILLNGDVRYSMLIASGIENLRFETACIEKGNQ